MKTSNYLFLPLGATLVNAFLAWSIFSPNNRADSQPADQFLGAINDAERVFELDLLEEKVDGKSPETAAKDPMLYKMPGYDFEAYVRADVSTFYGEDPGSREEFVPDFQGQACKFVNMSPNRVGVYWVDDDGRASAQASIGPWQSGGTACYPTHSFIFTKPKRPDQVICKILVEPGTSVYFCDPFVPNDLSIPAHGEWIGSPRNLNELSPEDRDWYDAHAFNIKFGEDYKNFTGGSEWLSMFPRNPPRHHIWRADYFGQTHLVTTNETHFVSIPDGPFERLSVESMHNANYKYASFRQPGLLNLTLKALSCAPRAFEIRNFLSDAEVEHIVRVVNKKQLVRSTTGDGSGGLSMTRTSRTTWIPRHTDHILDAIFRRVADVLRIDEALMRHRRSDEHPDFESSNPINEDLQIVHYDVGQEYTAHHDFSYPTGVTGLGGDHPARSINLCMYLNDTPEGGHTSFPRWRNGHTSEAISVKPEKGKAMIFYMTNPDGNLDDLTQHAAMPVLEGEKYFANLWIHDPFRE